jgi:hypothetical protein
MTRLAASPTSLASALAVLVVTVGCVNERTYVDPESNTATMGGWQGFEGTGTASLRGDVGQLGGIDNSAEDMWVTRDVNVLEMSGNVPHQAQAGSSVFLDIRILNGSRLAVGQELRQEGTVDTWSEDVGDEPVLDVYVCPNGEGVSGNADDIVVTRTGPETFTFEARSSNPEQNLDVDLDLAANEG